MVRVERYEAGGWRSTCMACGSTALYWWNDQVWEPVADGSMRRLTSYGPVLYEYALAADDA
jgi:hypothetical protein